ncbi:hypothetical protein ACWEPN_27405 [Nonomuraea wenchangensis]
MFTAGSLGYTARSLETSQEGHITDRYTKAVEQLGSRRSVSYWAIPLIHPPTTDIQAALSVLGGIYGTALRKFNDVWPAIQPTFVFQESISRIRVCARRTWTKCTRSASFVVGPQRHGKA